MLDLQPIKDRLSLATPGPWSLDVTYFQPKSIWARVGKLFSADDATFGDCALIANAPADIAALIAEVERLTAENDSQEARICHLLDEADKRIDADIQRRNASIGRPAETVRNIDRLQAEVERLRGAIQAHRDTTARRLGGASPWATDAELWRALDAYSS